MPGAVLVAISVSVGAPYGLATFVLSPFVLGLLAALTLNGQREYAWRWSGAATVLGEWFAGLILFAFGFEGLICLVMAFPLTLLIGILGTFPGCAFARRFTSPATTWLVLLVLVPALSGAEARLGAPATVRSVVTTIDIDAPPSIVWPNVIALDELPPPTAAPFRMGIAYPVRARLDGQGVGATRYCEFSSGPFVEPITAWEPGRRLAFDVAAQPESMHELTPYREIHPPHLRNGLRFRRGEFLLTELPGGRTRLRGTTWYEVHLAPAFYWALWSDALIHRIHLRVLRHVARLAEREAR